jgi:hypothetical protein
MRTLFEIRVIQGFFTNTYNKRCEKPFFKTLHAVKNPLGFLKNKP